MKVSPKALELATVQDEMSNGLLLCSIMKALVPKTVYVNLNRRPRARKPAIANIEQALSVIWRGGKVNNRRIPSAVEIYEKKKQKILVMIGEIFEVYTMRKLRKNVVPQMLHWYDAVLRQYGRPLDFDTATPPYNGLFAQFTSGVR